MPPTEHRLWTPEERALIPEGHKAIERALSAARRGVAHHEVCVFCKKPLVVEGEDTLWYVHCACGKSSATFKGL